MHWTVHLQCTKLYILLISKRYFSKTSRPSTRSGPGRWGSQGIRTVAAGLASCVCVCVCVCVCARARVDLKSSQVPVDMFKGCPSISISLIYLLMEPCMRPSVYLMYAVKEIPRSSVAEAGGSPHNHWTHTDRAVRRLASPALSGTQSPPCRVLLML